MRLSDETLAMPGYEVLRRLQQVASMPKIVLGNAAEIESHFVWLNEPANPVPFVRLWNLENRHALDADLDEVERLVFNLLSSCYSWFEFYRMPVNAGPIEGLLWVEYDKRIEAFSRSLLHRWTIALRRLMQDDGLPVTRGQRNLAQGGPIRTDAPH